MWVGAACAACAAVGVGAAVGVEALEVFAAASKVEAAYKRAGGLQGTLMVCFQTGEGRRKVDALAMGGKGLAQHGWGCGV